MIAATCHVYLQIQLVAEGSDTWRGFQPITNFKWFSRKHAWQHSFSAGTHG